MVANTGFPCAQRFFTRLSRIVSSFFGGGPGGLLINLVGVSWDCSATASHQKVQVRSLMRLKNMIDIQFCPTPLGGGWWCPLGAPLTQDGVVHFQPNRSGRYVEGNHVTRVHQGQGSTDGGFR